MMHHCTQCNKSYERRSNYTVHMQRTHSKEAGKSTPQSSTTCIPVKLKSRNSDQETFHQHEEQDDLTCHVCGKTFKWRQNLKDHLTIHSGDRPFKCDICGMTFRLISYCRRHKFLTHSGKPALECKLCGMRPIDMNKHIAYKHGDRPFPCVVCNKSFKTITQRKRHQQNIHNTKTNTIHQSDRYKNSLGHNNDRKPVRSIRTVKNNVGNQTHNKSKVGNSFSQANRLNSKTFHAKKKASTWRCRICGRIFEYKFSYKRHLEWHNRVGAGLVTKRRPANKRFPSKVKNMPVETQITAHNFTVNLVNGTEETPPSVTEDEYWQKQVVKTRITNPIRKKQSITADQVNGIDVQEQDSDDEEMEQKRNVKKRVLVPTRRHRCDICDESLANKNILARHRQIHAWETALQS